MEDGGQSDQYAGQELGEFICAAKYDDKLTLGEGQVPGRRPSRSQEQQHLIDTFRWTVVWHWGGGILQLARPFRTQPSIKQ